MRPAAFVSAPADVIHLRQAQAEDIEALNGVIERAIMTWKLPERVKRLSLSIYRYQPHDLEHLHIVLAEDAAHGVVGVAAWELANPVTYRQASTGFYCMGSMSIRIPASRCGTKLLDATLHAARELGMDGLLVKAQADANGFFAARGLERLPVLDPARDYPSRFWKAVQQD